MSCRKGLRQCIEYLRNMSEEEAEEFRRSWQAFSDEWDREAREETEKFLQNEILANPNLPLRVKLQVQRVIAALNSTPYITVQTEGVYLDYHDVFAGHLTIVLNGWDDVLYGFAGPYPTLHDMSGFVKENEIPELVHDYFTSTEERKILNVQHR